MRIGIDLGTTFSVGAYVTPDGVAKVLPNRDGANTTPSVIMFDGDEVVVGKQAKDNAVMDPYSVVQFVKRHMGESNGVYESESGKEYRAEELSAMILKRIKEDCEAALNETIDEAVITVPAYFNDAQRIATQNAGRIAGLNVLAIINEPTAAAIAYGADKTGTLQRVMIYDLGGGTFDVTIIEIAPDGSLAVKATHGNRNLGGMDFDNKLMSWALDQFTEITGKDISDDDEAMQLLRAKCEEAKIALSARDKYTISLNAGGAKAKIEITRDMFSDMIRYLVEETEIDIDIALEDSGLTPADINKVLLVGGSSRIPCVQEFVRKKLGIAPSTELHPDEAVALGAAIYAEKLPGGKPVKPGLGETTTLSGPPIQDVNSHGVGVVANDENDKPINSIIVKKNTPIPCAGSMQFYTAVDNQTEILLQLTEGDDDDLDYVAIIGQAELHLNPHEQGAPIRVDIGYDSNGVITCRVFDETDRCFLGDVVVKRDGTMSASEVAKLSSDMADKDIQ